VPRVSHWLTRALVLRSLGFVYSVAFAVALTQARPLFGEHGITPAAIYFDRVAARFGGAWPGFRELPSIFWASASDAMLAAAAWLGLAGSLAVLAGVANAALLAVLWVLYLSFVHAGQVWYGYGWETLLCEAGFLAIFLCPLRSWRAFDAIDRPPAVVIWLFRWLAVRVVLGAGLIKVRGDPCWRQLTCLEWHYETQPVPSPPSWLLHHMPAWFHQGGVLFNHFVELIVPFGIMAPRPWRTAAGVFCVLFQLLLITSGNLSFLNWLTLAVCLACFDDQPLLRVVPARWRERLRGKLERLSLDAEPSAARRWVVGGVAALVAVLSLNPIVNMASPVQSMNRSFDPLHLVNTYGAFGSVHQERHEVIIEGTSDLYVGPDSKWLEYQLPCKPGDPMRRPCLITPWHYRLDWQAWFAGLPHATAEQHPWVYRVLYLLLRGDPGIRGLFAYDPFPAEPPRWVRVEVYRYRFTAFGEPGWWHRERIGTFIDPVSLDDPGFLGLLRAYGWL
jgi:lipase maturation factor